MIRKFVPATIHRPCLPRTNDYGEEITELVADPTPIDIAVSVITGAYAVQSDVRAVRATHAALTPCRTLNEAAQIECDGRWYTVEYANNLTPRWATLYLKEVRADGHQRQS